MLWGRVFFYRREQIPRGGTGGTERQWGRMIFYRRKQRKQRKRRRSGTEAERQDFLNAKTLRGGLVIGFSAIA